MRYRHLLLPLFLVLVSSFALTACGSDDDAKPDSDKQETSKAERDEQKLAEMKQPKIKAPEPICPQVAIVRGLDLVKDYGNEPPAPDQLVSAGKMVKIEGDCAYTDEGVDVKFSVNMAMKRGPRLGGSHVGFPIFVAVLDPAGDVLNKDQMTVEINFSSDEAVAFHAEPLHVFIPLAKDQQNLGPSYKVLTGFQLSPAQADHAKTSLKP